MPDFFPDTRDTTVVQITSLLDLEQDAARYRWLVENHAWDMLVFVRSTRPYTDAREVFADSIDAAMKA